MAYIEDTMQDLGGKIVMLQGMMQKEKQKIVLANSRDDGEVSEVVLVENFSGQK